MSTGTFMFNPFTGKPRHPSDIKSDPKGLLIVDPDDGCLLAASDADLAKRISQILKEKRE